VEEKISEHPQLADCNWQARELIAGKVERFEAGEIAEPLRQVRELVAGKVERFQASKFAD
jgi:hypothetical protein